VRACVCEKTAQARAKLQQLKVKAERERERRKAVRSKLGLGSGSREALLKSKEDELTRSMQQRRVRNMIEKDTFYGQAMKEIYKWDYDVFNMEQVLSLQKVLSLLSHCIWRLLLAPSAAHLRSPLFVRPRRPRCRR